MSNEEREDPASPSIDTGGGAHVAGDVITDGGDFIGRDTIIAGDHIRAESITIRNGAAHGLIVVACLAILAMLVLAIVVQRHDRPTEAIKGPQLPSVSRTVGTEQHGTLLTTPVPATPTLAPAPTPTVLVLPNADVLIAEFDPRYSEYPIEIARRLEDGLRATLREQHMTDVRVARIPHPISDAEVADIAAHSRANVIIWGWYDRLGIQVKVHLGGANIHTREIGGVRELPFELGDSSGATTRFTVQNILPDNVSFLSLFVLGHLKYLNNDFVAGHTAFDAAMSNIPSNVALENEAIVHFFEARRLDASDATGALYHEQAQQVICEYINALKLDHTLAEAYNNLGVVLGRATAFDRIVGDRGRACLETLGLDEYDAQTLFDRASKGRPGWAVPKYNALADTWNHFGDRNTSIAQIKLGLQRVVATDPGIAGAHILLGNIAVEGGDYQRAIECYQSAQHLDPESDKLRFNLGEAFLLDQQYAAAEQRFHEVLNNNVDDPEAEREAHLAFAAVAYAVGDLAAAEQRLAAVPEIDAQHPANFRVAKAAVLLRSAIAFAHKDRTKAIEILERYAASLERWEPDEYGLKPDLERLEQYILAMLYTLDGREQIAAPYWPETNETERQNLRSRIDFFFMVNDTSELTWQDIVLECADHEGGSAVAVAEWGSSARPCLPGDLNERIDAVYALFRLRLGYRLFYQKAPEVILWCPYVYTYDRQEGIWRWDTTILTGLDSQQREAFQRRPLQRFDGRLLIREVEPEHSYIDQIYIIEVDHQGRKTVLQPDLALVAEADQVYLELEQREEVLLHFPDYQGATALREVWVVAKGYYVRLNKEP